MEMSLFSSALIKTHTDTGTHTCTHTHPHMHTHAARTHARAQTACIHIYSTQYSVYTMYLQFDSGFILSPQQPVWCKKSIIYMKDFLQQPQNLQQITPFPSNLIPAARDSIVNIFDINKLSKNSPLIKIQDISNQNRHVQY